MSPIGTEYPCGDSDPRSRFMSCTPAVPADHAFSPSRSNSGNIFGSAAAATAFGVSKPEGASNANWRELGAAWQHRDAKGFRLQLKSLPTTGEELVMRSITPRKAAADTTTAA